MLDIPTKRRRDNSKPKGRQLDDQALADVQRLLGNRERRRDLLIEFLHLIQDEVPLPAGQAHQGAGRRDALVAGGGV